MTASRPLPAPVTKELTLELMRRADLVVATGSQANVRAAYASGTPAFGVGAGNVAAIVDETADLATAAEKILRSKTFDNATSCSSENSVVLVDAIYTAAINAFKTHGAILVAPEDKARLQQAMWPDGKLSSQVIGQSATTIAQRAGLTAVARLQPLALLVEEAGIGAEHPFSGEKLSPVLTVYRARDFDDAMQIVKRVYAFIGAGHAVGLHTARNERALVLGQQLPVSRVIVNQVHCVATGGSFDNGLPFSLSMGCGTWGRNNFSDNMNYRHYLNITRVSTTITEDVPEEADILGDYFARYGRA